MGSNLKYCRFFSVKSCFNRYNWRAGLWRIYMNCWLLFYSPFIPLGFDNIGFRFWWRGDDIWWTWPWKRKGLPKYISLGFSGTGEFGDARFHTLKEIDKMWYDFECDCLKKHEEIWNEMDRLENKNEGCL